jgi:8-oxo-dGTP pyrophosphatase MutT (NUDIX family)
MKTSSSPQLEEQPTLFEMEDIPLDEQQNRGWELAVNGQPLTEVQNANITNSKIGIDVMYGKRPEGYDGVVIREPGGAVTVPYMVDEDGRFYIGVVEEYRPTMGETTTMNVPRGFSDFGETKEQTANREFMEETGYQALGSQMVKLAEGLNPNSTYFDYSQSPDAGVSIFAVQVKAQELELSHDEEGNIYYTFPAHIREQAEGDKAAERILGSRFIPLTAGLESRDMFTSAAAGQLVSHLLSKGEYLVPQNQPEPQSK